MYVESYGSILAGKEDSGSFVDNLNRQQLSAKAEIRLRNKNVEENENTENIESPELSVEYKIRKNKHTSDTGKLSFLNDIVEFLNEESTRYALCFNEEHPKIFRKAMKRFIAILILTSYNKLPGRNAYWNSKNDMKNYMVIQTMRRVRFRQILKHIHCADNIKQPDNSDKLWKLRPFMRMLSKIFMENWILEEHLDFHESMIKYFGRNLCKQFILGKPIRFRYKMHLQGTKEQTLMVKMNMNVNLANA
ncbi:hypothetical protein ILUMI_11489 [Ignelater luminosus]|uniref:PiggyBac transposable element-derived protein domain-containing protein n=1 Tax=Ignelater luminosus TaxID=2038154 RepID=A0A8K0CVW5_IGNLU|nr:hypothetical protein ILUMI_11489 [Ignelater luminosus]